MPIKKDKKTNYELKISHIIPIQNCLQFDAIIMILDKRVKSQGVCEEEHDFIIGTPMNHNVATHPTSGHRHFKITFLFNDSLTFLLLCKITVVVLN